MLFQKISYYLDIWEKQKQKQKTASQVAASHLHKKVKVICQMIFHVKADRKQVGFLESPGPWLNDSWSQCDFWEMGAVILNYEMQWNEAGGGVTTSRAPAASVLVSKEFTSD